MSTQASLFQLQKRCVSSSPYGRTHVWKKRPIVIPNPVVPKFPQRVILANGASFTHFTTSPRSLIRLPRDTTNNPIWNTYLWADEGAMEDEANTTGRLGRFNRRFEGVGGVGTDGRRTVEWMSGAAESEGELVDPSGYMTKKEGRKK